MIQDANLAIMLEAESARYISGRDFIIEVE
jgi:hypothetical protein